MNPTSLPETNTTQVNPLIENKYRSNTPIKEFTKHFRKHVLGMLGLGGVTFLFLIAIFAPLISPYPEGYGTFEQLLQAPNFENWFGTDSLGLNIFDQVVWGTRTSLYVGFVAAMISVVIGVPIGLLAGYYGGRISTLGMGLTDIFLTLPILPLMIILAAVLGTGINNIAIIIGLFSWPFIARVTRAETLAIAEKQYIEAAKAIGTREYKIIFKHILLNASPPILVNMTIIMATAVISEAGLSFLGLGDPSTWSWGRILQNAHASGAIIQAWWYSFFASLSIMVLVLSFNFLGMGINEALNPRQRGRS
jgi:peptide/nickel transport system permease protein